MHELFKNVHFRKFQFVFLRVKLKSEVYLTSSHFSFSPIFLYAHSLAFKNILRFLKNLFFSLFGNGPGTDGDRFMIYVLLSA